MAKFLSVAEMESELLSHSVAEDIGMLDKNSDTPPEQTADKVLTADEVRHDTSVMARILIRAWVGWPFVKQLQKRKILNKLLHIYNTARSITTLEYFRLLGPVFDNIPDNHTRLNLEGYGRLYTKLGHAATDVGENIAKDSEKQILTYMRPDKIAVCGITSCAATDEFKSELDKFATECLPQSDAVIIDLRGNGGGNSRYTDSFSDVLCGRRLRSLVRYGFRTTPEARRMQHGSLTKEYIDAGKVQKYDWNTQFDTDVVWRETKENTKPNTEKFYNRPIYILIDNGVMSSAEMFCLRMAHHPCVKFVGSNSRGGEVDGDCGSAYLPHSRLKYTAGCFHRELEPQYKNFELRGLTPDIIVPDGQDAMEYAVKDYENTLLKQHALQKQSEKSAK